MDVLPTGGVLVAYTLAVLALNYTPGPDMAMFVGTTITGGRRAGIAAFLGTNTGILVHTMLVTFGLAALLAASPVAFDVLKVVGAVPGITGEQFEEAAQAAKVGCPVSQALAAVPITLEVTFSE